MADRERGAANERNYRVATLFSEVTGCAGWWAEPAKILEKERDHRTLQQAQYYISPTKPVDLVRSLDISDKQH